MFERTFAFWQRLIGKSPAPTAAVAVEDDRRLWTRHATDLDGNVQLADKRTQEKIPANVRDLSAGGANLVVDRPLQPGHMVTLEMPTNDGELRTVLACVVRATPQEAGSWSLGCVFSRELSSDELTSFGAKKTAAGDEDKRVWVRYSGQLQARCRKYGEADSEAQTVQVLNVSASGIGLVVNPRVDAGALLTVDLLSKTGRKVCAILACVVHTTKRATGDFAVGCNFIRELSEEELQLLL